MTRKHLLALLLLPALAGAEDGGESAFNTACARCHSAPPGSAKSAGAQSALGPALDALLTGRTPQQLRAWVRAPQQVRPDTRCDTRLLAAGDVDVLLSYLATRAQPPPPPRDELLRQQLQRDLAERRARKQRQPSDTARRQP
jgi:cytochrome c